MEIIMKIIALCKKEKSNGLNNDIQNLPSLENITWTWLVFWVSKASILISCKLFVCIKMCLTWHIVYRRCIVGNVGNVGVCSPYESRTHPYTTVTQLWSHPASWLWGKLEFNSSEECIQSPFGFFLKFFYFDVSEYSI